MQVISRNAHRCWIAGLVAATIALTAGCGSDRTTSPVATLPRPTFSGEVPTVSPVSPVRILPISPGQPRPGLLTRSSALQASSSISTATGSPDLVWFENDGTVLIWQMNGPSFSGGGAVPLQIPAPWSLVASADLNADGHPDLIWEATDGTRAVTFMNGGNYAGSYAMMFQIPPEWHIVGAADFDGDTKPDLVLNNLSTGASGVLYLNGTAWTGVFSALPSFAGWQIAAVGDMNNDSKPDIVWRDTTNTITAPIVSTMNGLSVIATQTVTPAPPSTAWRVGAVADFDGDGKGDFLMQNVSDGSRMIWHMNVTSRIGFSYLPTVPTSYKVVAAKLFQWPAVNSYIINMSQGSSTDMLGEHISGLPTSCSPTPSCLSSWSKIAGEFLLNSPTYIDHIDGWMRGTGGFMYVNIRAGSPSDYSHNPYANPPGEILYSKVYAIGDYGFALWLPFSQYGVTLPAGLYWVSFEAVDYTGLDLQMPRGTNFGYSPGATLTNTSNNFWRTYPGALPLEFGYRISGHVVP